MSIVKDVNVNGSSVDDSASLLAYLIDKLKTGGGKYVAGLGFITDNYLDEFQAVKLANQKTGGRQFRQITIVPSPAGNNCTKDHYLEIGRKIAEYYYERRYQVIVPLHLDTDTWHLHLMLNSVNYRTGKMFSQSKSELNRFKLHCNHVFSEYGLDQIRKSADEMVSTIIHEMSEGFDCLELFDEIMADRASVLSALCNDDTEFVPETVGLDLGCLDRNTPRHPTDYSDITSDYNCRRYFGNSALFGGTPPPSARHKPIKPNQTKEEQPMNYPTQRNDLPAVNTDQLPAVNDSNSGLSVDYSRNINMTVPNSWSSEQLADFVNRIEPIPEHERAFNAKVGDALTSDLHSRGVDTPVHISSGININLTFDSVMNSTIIDLPSGDPDF